MRIHPQFFKGVVTTIFAVYLTSLIVETFAGIGSKYPAFTWHLTDAIGGAATFIALALISFALGVWWHD